MNASPLSQVEPRFVRDEKRRTKYPLLRLPHESHFVRFDPHFVRPFVHTPDKTTRERAQGTSPLSAEKYPRPSPPALRTGIKLRDNGATANHPKTLMHSFNLRIFIPFPFRFRACGILEHRQRKTLREAL
jgi:hypothetical protein